MSLAAHSAGRQQPDRSLFDPFAFVSPLKQVARASVPSGKAVRVAGEQTLHTLPHNYGGITAAMTALLETFGRLETSRQGFHQFRQMNRRRIFQIRPDDLNADGQSVRR